MLGPVERLFYAVSGVDRDKEQSWLGYTLAMLAFSIAGFVVLYLILRFQDLLPLNPQGFAGVAPDLAFNTAVSFVTNTNWQSYGGETTMSHLSQMAGLTVQNFLSAATGIALAVALTRAFARSSGTTIGNFWVDLTRTTLYVLLPISIVVALAFVAHGPAADARRLASTATTLEGAQADHRARPGRQPGGDQAARHQWRRLLQRQRRASVREPQRVLELPQDLRDARGHRRRWSSPSARWSATAGRAGRSSPPWASCSSPASASIYWAETFGNPLLTALGIDPAMGNMEGKEVRFGQAMTALYAAVTTGISDGGVNAMHDSLTPLGGLVPMFLIQLGEILPGGVGSGLYGMLVFAILAVFVAGLMVGRTPEYLGKKIEAREMKFAMLAVLILPLAILGFTAVSAVLPFALSARSPTPARTACPRSSTPTPRRPGTTARPSPASPPTRPGSTPRSASPCCSAASPMSCR